MEKNERGALERALTLMACLILVCWVAASCARSTGEPDEGSTDDLGDSGLVGFWLGSAEHEGQPGEFAFDLDRDEDGRLIATLSLPSIDAWDIGRVPVDESEDGALQILSSRFERTANGGLRGPLPAELVPVHEIEVLLERSERSRHEQAASEPADSEPAGEPEQLWRRDLESPIWADLTILGSSVLVGTDEGLLHRIAVEGGQEIWTVDPGSTGGAIRAQPVVAGNVILVSSDDGELSVLGHDGGPHWTRRIDSPMDRSDGSEAARRYAFQAPAPRVDTSGGRVYVPVSEGLVVLALESGDEVRRVGSDQPASSQPLLAAGKVYVTSFDGSVVALDQESGEQVWRAETGAAINTSPALAGELLVVGSRSYELLGLDLETGARAWSYYSWYSWMESSPRVVGDVVYAGSSDSQQLHAIDARTGSVLWTFDTGGSAWGRPFVVDDLVLIGTVGVADYMVEHQATLWAVSRPDGRPRWRVRFERPDDAPRWGVGSSVVGLDGRVVVGRLDGVLAAYSLD